MEEGKGEKKMKVEELNMEEEIKKYFKNPYYNGAWYLKPGRLKSFRKQNVEYKTMLLKTLRDYSFKKYDDNFVIVLNTGEDIQVKEWDKDTWRLSDGSKLGTLMTIEQVMEYFRSKVYGCGYLHPTIKVYRELSY